MTTFPGSLRILKGGIVLIDPVTGQVLPDGVIVLQYNPDTLSRTLKIKGMEEGRAVPRVRASGIQLASETHPTRLGQRIAKAVYGGIGERR